MLDRFGITDDDWHLTPAPVQQAFSSLHHQLLLLEIRSQAYERQLAQLRKQVAQIDILKAEMEELRERLGKNSSNSSKPPSSDPPHQRQQSSPDATGRKPGGQPGHPGRGRKLKVMAQVDQVIDIRPISCLHCGELLMGDDPHPVRRQVSEVPTCQAQVTEYRRHRLKCLACGAANQAQWPADIPPGSFGSRAQAIIGYLSGRLGASHRDVAEVMNVMPGLEISLGSVAAVQQRVSAALATPVQTAQSYVQRQAISYVDETSWPQQNKPRWLWLNATSSVTAFRILAGRGAAQARQLISKTARGVVTTDRYNAYNWLPLRRRQICWAHLKRDFQAIAERGGESAAIGQELVEQTREVFHLWHKGRGGEITRSALRRKMKPMQQRVKELLYAGTQSGHYKTRHTCANIMQIETALWTFVRVEGVEPTNNNAERPLRRAVLWRRKSFGTQSESGSRFVERILTAVTSLRQQGRDVLEYLTSACASVSGSLQPCCLVPDSS